MFESEGTESAPTPVAASTRTLEDVLLSMENTNQALSRTAAAMEHQSASRVQPEPFKLPELDPYEGQDPTTFDGDKLRKYVDHAAERRAKKLVEADTEPMKREIASIRQAEQQRQAADIGKQIEDARKKYPDFNKAAPIIGRLAQEHPTLNVNQLYRLAKDEIPVDDKPKSAVAASSERPTHSAARPPAKVTREVPLPRGRQGISLLIRESLSKKQFPLR